MPESTNYGPSVFGQSWYQTPREEKRMSPVNPFEDIVTRSYNNTSQNHLARRSLSKGMISQPAYQGSSLEFDEKRS
jgi:hypothetical protein